MDRNNNPTSGIEVIILSMNEKLERTTANYAEQGMAVGCGISVIPVGMLILIALLLGIRSWIALLLISILGIISAAGILSLIASRSGSMAAKRIFKDEILPEMEKILKEYAITDHEFSTIVYQHLPDHAPLSKFLKLRV